MSSSRYHVERIARGVRFRLTRRLPERHPVDVWPEIDGAAVICKPFRARFGNVSQYELLVLCAVAKTLNVQRVFEFGTFDGLTTWHLVANSATAAQVHTLDLPLEHPARFKNAHDRTVGKIHGTIVGEQYQSTPEGHRVIQILQDSMEFDATPYRGTMDLCFIDASHEYCHVCKDTENALAMTRPGGVIFWHDYSRWWPGVQRCLDDLSNAHPVFRVADTSLASLVIPTHGPAND